MLRGDCGRTAVGDVTRGWDGESKEDRDDCAPESLGRILVARRERSSSDMPYELVRVVQCE